MNQSTNLDIWLQLFYEGANINYLMPTSKYLDGCATVLEWYLNNNEFYDRKIVWAMFDAGFDPSLMSYQYFSKIDFEYESWLWHNWLLMVKLKQSEKLKKVPTAIMREIYKFN